MEIEDILRENGFTSFDIALSPATAISATAQQRLTSKRQRQRSGRLIGVKMPCLARLYQAADRPSFARSDLITGTKALAESRGKLVYQVLVGRPLKASQEGWIGARSARRVSALGTARPCSTATSLGSFGPGNFQPSDEDTQRPFHCNPGGNAFNPERMLRDGGAD